MTAAKDHRSVLEGFSLEMTGKDVESLRSATNHIPVGTRINVTFLGNEDLETRVSAARAVRDAGFVPVPHISARRLHSKGELVEFFDALRSVGATDEVFVIGGDPAEARGPFTDSLSVIDTGVLKEFGVKRVGIAGYPNGHPDISDDVLRTALMDKHAALQRHGLETTITTQFGFDTTPVLAWIRSLRSAGITAPIRVGVPGPAGVKRLLGYARRFGVASSTGIVQKYGFSLTNLLGTAGPGRFISELATGRKVEHGEVLLHFYTFGGVENTAAWIQQYTADAARS